MNPTATMRHLLWKDLYQVRPALAGCLAMLACHQLLYLVAQLLEQDASMSIFQDAYLIALGAPTLSAMACSGLLIGQERQTRTWNWSSSLPVTWSSALASKFLVWLVVSVAMTALLLLLYALLYWVALLSGRTAPPLSLWQEAELRFMFAMLVLIPIEVFVVFNIAALLWNETLLALVIAAIAVCIGHLLLIDTLARAVHGIPWDSPFRPQDYLGTAVALLGAAIALAALGLCYVFRWRWTSGQLASFSVREFMGSRGWMLRPWALGQGSSLAYASSYKSTTASRGKATSLVRWLGKPNETAMMFMHAWQSSLNIRLAIVIAILSMLAIAPSQWHIYPIAVVSGALLLGVTVFGGEHALNRYRFFADRGAFWLSFLFTHVLAACAWLLALLLTTYWLVSMRDPLTDFGDPIFVALCAFGVAVFSSLCIANSVIATALAALTLLGCASCYYIADTFGEMLVGPRGHVYAVLPLTVVIVLVALLYQTRRWLVFERPRSVRVLVAAWLVGLAFPIWLAFTFGYLAVPAIEWQGIPASQLDIKTQARLPKFKTETPELTVAVARPPMAASVLQAQITFGNSLGTHLLQIEQRHGSVQEWLDAWKDPLEQLSAEVSDPNALAFASPQSVVTYFNLIEQTALIGVTATTQVRDRERAVAAWRLNRSLLKLGEDNPDLAVQTVVARTTTWGLWDLLNEDDLAFLRDEAELNSLLPGHVDNAVWAQALRTRWTERKVGLQNDRVPEWLPFGPKYQTSNSRSALKYYPPLRWTVERQMAHQLNRELESLQGRRPLAPLRDASWISAHDPIAYEIQLLRQLEQQVTAKVSPPQ